MLLVLTEGIFHLLFLPLHVALNVPLQASQPPLISLKVEVVENFSHFLDGSLHQVLNMQYSQSRQ